MPMSSRPVRVPISSHETPELVTSLVPRYQLRAPQKASLCSRGPGETASDAWGTQVLATGLTASAFSVLRGR